MSGSEHDVFDDAHGVGIRIDVCGCCDRELLTEWVGRQVVRTEVGYRHLGRTYCRACVGRRDRPRESLVIGCTIFVVDMSAARL